MMLNKPMKPIDKEDTINKSILLNWLYSADKELSDYQSLEDGLKLEPMVNILL